MSRTRNVLVSSEATLLFTRAVGTCSPTSSASPTGVARLRKKRVWLEPRVSAGDFTEDTGTVDLPHAFIDVFTCPSQKQTGGHVWGCRICRSLEPLQVNKHSLSGILVDILTGGCRQSTSGLVSVR